MAVREMVTKSDVLLAHQGSIASNTTTNTTIIDTADYDVGISFYLSAPVYTDGTFKLTFQEGDDSGLSDATTVPAVKIVPISDSAQDAVNTGITEQTDDGDRLVKAGIHSTKRYVRANIVSTGVTSGATVNLAVQRFAENIAV